MIATRMKMAAAGGQVAPDAPTGLTATPSSTSQVDLSWTDNATTETGYKIYRSTDGSSYSLLDTIAAGSTSYNDATITAGTTYYYKAAAYNGAGEAESNADAANTLTLSMESFWELEEASGNRSDSHGANTLTDNNTVTSNTGKVGTAAEFVAANSEYLSRASNASLQVGNIDFSFAFWVRLANVATTQILVAKYFPSANLQYRFDIASSRFRFLVSNDGSSLASVTANTFGAPSNDTWYLVMGWHDATGNTINISVNNGTADSTAHSTGVFSTGTGAFTIGASAAPATYMTGLIDQVVFSKRLWVANEKASIYNGGSGRAYSYIVP